MKNLKYVLPFLSMLVIPLHTSVAQSTQTTLPASHHEGRWHVKFTLTGIGEKNLIIEARKQGIGSFLFLDAGPDNKPAPAPAAGVWSETTNDRVSFSSEVELPMGTCCREMGTFILKGKFSSSSSISGKAIFIASTTDEENIIGFRSAVGTFTATRLPNQK